MVKLYLSLNFFCNSRYFTLYLNKNIGYFYRFSDINVINYIICFCFFLFILFLVHNTKYLRKSFTVYDIQVD